MDIKGLMPVYGDDVSDQYPSVKVSIEHVTPEVASEMLALNVANRDVKRESIAKAIMSGEWSLNGATIVFSTDNVLLDGQNRLLACVRTGVPIDTIVVRGIKAEAQVTMDTGVKRSVSDYLKMSGVKDYATVGAIGFAIYRRETYGMEGMFTMANGYNYTVRGVLDFIEKNHDERIRPLVPIVRKVAKRYKGISYGTSGALADVFRSIDSDSMQDFIDKLCKSDQSVSSIRLLSDKLTSNSMSKQGRLPQKVIAALIIKAWNYYMVGAEMKQLKFTAGGAHPESFPEVFRGYE